MLVRGIWLLLALGGAFQLASQGEVVIRTTTSLVEVRVVAEGKDGNPVANLEKSDFEILDNGEPQTIRLFAAYRGPNPPMKGAGATAKSADDSPTPAGYALILLDWLNTSYSLRVRAQEMLLKSIREYQPRQRVAVYALSRVNPGLICDFTYDRNLLYDRVASMSLDPENMSGPVGEGPNLLPGRGPRANGPDESTPAREEAISRATRQLVDTTVEFEKIADHMVRVPGRKTLIWMTEGVPLVVGGSYFAPFIESALHRLNKADTAIYSIDAAGLRLWGLPSNSLLEFSRRTGGVAYYDNNDLDASVRRALDDMGVSYTLGFHMPEGAKPGSHEIKVRVGRPHVKLRYRESYDPAAAIH
jgi:VWFA-related protein